MLPSVLTYGGTCLPNRIYSDAPAYAAVLYQAFHYTVSPTYRAGFERGAVAKLSRHNQAHHLSVKRLDRVDRQFVSFSRVSPVLNIREVLPRSIP